MPSTDPVSDLLAALKNASVARLETARLPVSRFKQAVLKALQDEGFIRSFQVVKGRRGSEIEVRLNSGPRRERLFNGARRISRPGRRVYAGLGEIKPYLRRLEVLVVSTPHGVLTGAQAFARKTGGELLFQVW
jgi:small subunit ribosomal protein S8